VKFSGEIAVPAPQAAVFAKLRDAKFFASCVEGVQELKEIDETHYTGVLETRVAYIKFKFAIAVEVTEIVEPNKVAAKVEGTPIGVVGRLTATSVATLREHEGQTVIGYDIESTLTGKLGSIGQPVMRAKAKEMERQFTASLRAAFEPSAAGANK
jgi:carbon monoxide dehydrogenase subunit G